MKQFGIRWLVMIAIASAAAWGFLKWKGAEARDRSSVQIVAATQGTMKDTVEATGEVTPLNRVEVKPPIQGRIEKLLVDEGDRVKAGQILAWMSSSDRAAILDAARAKGPEEHKRWDDTYKATPLVAPLSGVIILRNVVVGQTVDLSTILFALSDKLIVLAHIDEVDVGRIRADMPASITLDAYPDVPIDGKVVNILFEGKNVSNVITYDVKIEPKEVPPFFRSQMTANISLVINRKDNVVMIPAVAVQENSSGDKQVLVPGPEKKPIAKPVEVGMESDGQVEIVSGLEPGERVIVSSKRYSPQRGTANSPLIMQRRQRNAGQKSGGASERSGR